MSIKFGHGFQLPDTASTETFAFIGKRRSGKTYSAKKLAEGLFEIGCQIGVVDSVGIWWALRRHADGESAGLDIPILGGAHGDVPLEPEAGAIVARWVVDTGSSFILDVSHFRKAQYKRFMADFGEELFHLKKTRSDGVPIHLFIEEAQLIVPQHPRKGEERMLGAFEDIIRIGGNFGIGCSLISQRPQSINKEVLNQTECLVLGRLPGPHERKAIKEWIVVVGADVDKNWLDELPKLETAYKFIWSPSWLEVFQKVKINKIRSFDSSKTPELGKKTAAMELAPVDLAQLTADMETAIERAMEDDPKALRTQIQRLQADLEAVRDHAKRTESELLHKLEQQKTVPVEVPVITDEVIELIDDAVQEARAAGEAIMSAANEMKTLILVDIGVDVKARPDIPRTPSNGHTVSKPVPPTNHTSLPAGAERMLTVLAQIRSPMTRRQLATLAGMSHKSGTFGTYLSKLRTQGLIAENGERIAISDEGAQLIGAVPALDRGALISEWRGKLPRGCQRMFDLLVDHKMNGLTRDELAELAEMSPKGGTFGTYLSKLRSNELILERDGRILISETLFSG